MKLSKKQREELKQKFGGRCAYCGCVLGDRFHADHVEPILRKMKYDENYNWVKSNDCYRPDLDVWDNLAPSCPPCNNYKHRMTLEDFRRSISQQIRLLRDHSMNFRTAERFGMLTVNSPEPIVFWFEKWNTTATQNDI